MISSSEKPLLDRVGLEVVERLLQGQCCVLHQQPMAALISVLLAQEEES